MAIKLPRLELWVQKYSVEHWGKEVECDIIWNKRIRVKNGQVVFSKNDLKPISLEISPSTVKDGCFKEVVLHELCHYHLLAGGINHGEFSEVFLSELRRVGGVMPQKVVGYTFKCIGCGEVILETKKRNMSYFELSKIKKCNCLDGIMMYYKYEECK